MSFYDQESLVVKDSGLTFLLKETIGVLNAIDGFGMGSTFDLVFDCFAERLTVFLLLFCKIG